jgi:hypothetical protein
MPRSTPITIAGSTALTTPAGAKSAHLRVACAGSAVILTVDSESAYRSIDCKAVRDMVVPVGPMLRLDFEPQSSTTFTATVRFSSQAFHRDVVLAQQCAAATTALSDLLSADNGLANGAIDQSQAQALMTQASAALMAAPAAGPASDDLAPLRSWLAGNPSGDPRAAPMPVTISELCADNESPMYLSSSYGG